MAIETNENLPVAVIGAGPVGLAAAAHLAERNLPFVVFEAGDGPAAAMRRWGHVTFFSPWRYNVDSAAARLLQASGWKRPRDDSGPLASELIDDYLAPLAALPALASNIRYGAKVVAATRQGMDRVPSKRRNARPFEITLSRTGGAVERVLARAVIDASGTWTTPNPAGASGRPAIGEDEFNRHITTGIPDVLGGARSRYAGKHIVVIGAGHSAMDSILNLAQLKAAIPATRITWAMRTVRAATLTLVLKIIMQLAIPIDLAAVLPSLFEQLGLPLIFQSPFAEWLLRPRIEPAWVNREHVAHAAHAELLVMPFDERVSHFASLAKYAVAFFRMSRSSVTRASSCFSRLISAD